MGMDVFGLAPAAREGEYFRANVWSWRPIHALCETVMHKRYPEWALNSGAGLKTQAKCAVLADRLKHYLTAHPREEIALESDMRVNNEGKFLPRGSTAGRSAYFTDREHVEEFIKFLRACGGFEIR